MIKIKGFKAPIEIIKKKSFGYLSKSAGRIVGIVIGICKCKRKYLFGGSARNESKCIQHGIRKREDRSVA